MNNPKIIWVGRILSALVGALFIFSGVMKLGGTSFNPEMPKQMEMMGLPTDILMPLGILELLVTVLYLIPATSVLGAVLLTGYVGGTIITHWRLGQPFIMQIVIGLVIWAGLYVREKRLWDILPIRRFR